jgi:hypothetical protein
MRTTHQKKARVRLVAAAALVIGIAVLAMAPMVEAAALEEGETNGIPPGGIIPDHAHFVALATSNLSTLMVTSGTAAKGKNCEQIKGSSTTVYDGSCTVNGQTLNPCVITGSGVTVIALNTSCFPDSEPGLTASIATSGPLAGCVTIGEYLPWSSTTGAFIMGLDVVLDASDLMQNFTTASCPAPSAGGIGSVISYPQ